MPLTIIQTLFKPDGPLARHIDGFKARAPQLEMAEAVVADRLKQMKERGAVHIADQKWSIR